MMQQETDRSAKMKLGEVIERILIESGLSISGFSRKVGYSRQYVYELLKTKDTGFSRNIQLDTLKRICDATGYGLERLLADIGYISDPKDQIAPNTIIVVKKSGEKVPYLLDEHKVALIESLLSSIAREKE